MSTESIFRNIVLKEPQDVEKFVQAMEKAQDIAMKTELKVPSYAPIPQQALDSAMNKFLSSHAS